MMILATLRAMFSTCKSSRISGKIGLVACNCGKTQVFRPFQKNTPSVIDAWAIRERPTPVPCQVGALGEALAFPHGGFIFLERPYLLIMPSNASTVIFSGSPIELMLLIREVWLLIFQFSP